MCVCGRGKHVGVSRLIFDDSEWILCAGVMSDFETCVDVS